MFSQPPVFSTDTLLDVNEHNFPQCHLDVAWANNTSTWFNPLNTSTSAGFTHPYRPVIPQKQEDEICFNKNKCHTNIFAPAESKQTESWRWTLNKFLEQRSHIVGDAVTFKNSTPHKGMQVIYHPVRFP